MQRADRSVVERNAATFSVIATFDAAGNVYVADHGNDAIRMITPPRVVTKVAGQVGVPGSGDSTGTMATFRLTGPAGLACLGGNRVAITSGNALLTATLP